jgi:hypothetical protein
VLRRVKEVVEFGGLCWRLGQRAEKDIGKKCLKGT